jgi:transcriptional regulator with XRE-family HTH domain
VRERPRRSQSRLGLLAGFDHNYVSRLESGARTPSRDAIESLARVLEASTAERDRLLTTGGFALPIDETSSVLMAVIAERRLQTDRWGV